MRSLFLAAAIAAAEAALAAMPAFELRPLLPDDPDYTTRETLSPADVDKDGDMDLFSGGDRSFWLENRGAAGWLQRVVSDSFDTDVGAAALDVDGDGWMDRAAGSFWHRNPGPPGAAPFKTSRFRAGTGLVHDQLAGDIDGDGRPDLVDIDYDGIRWYRNNPAPDGLWAVGFINRGPPGVPQHGGIALGDLDGDGDIDLTRVDRWYENADGKGAAWTERVNIDFGTFWPSGWGLAAKAIVLDLDRDGRNDLVQADCDLPNGHVAWFRNTDGKGLAWEKRLVKDSTDGQDFHSLVAADFDADGDADLFSMGSMSSARPPAAYVWENLDGKGGSWREHVIGRGQEGHEAAAMDVDGDGDIDVVAKSWTGGDHFFYENKRLSSAAVIPQPRAARRLGHRARAGAPRFGPGMDRDVTGRRERERESF